LRVALPGKAGAVYAGGGVTVPLPLKASLGSVLFGPGRGEDAFGLLKFDLPGRVDLPGPVRKQPPAVDRAAAS
jgi:hypothetical protein